MRGNQDGQLRTNRGVEAVACTQFREVDRVRGVVFDVDVASSIRKRYGLRNLDEVLGPVLLLDLVTDNETDDTDASAAQHGGKRDRAHGARQRLGAP